MMMQRKSFLWIVIILLIGAIGLFVLQSDQDVVDQQDAEIQTIEALIERLSLPEGWYAHRMSDSYALFTRQQTLPDIGATEGYAYGEQISISMESFTGIPEEWNQLVWINDEAMVHAKIWNTIGGHKVLRVEHEAGGADGKQVTYYLFTDNKAYVFSLYPLESYDSQTGQHVRNEENIARIDNLVKVFAAQL